MAVVHLPYHYQERFAQILLVPWCHELGRFLTAWARTEGGDALNNPWNTTYYLERSSTYNSAGVRNYLTPVEGICANAMTVAADARYLDWWKDMQALKKTGMLAEQLVARNAGAISLWGTDTVLLLQVLSEL